MRTIRIIGHGRPRQWHTVDEAFLARILTWVKKSKSDIMIEEFGKGIIS